jgi:hypothetical protein
MLTHKLLRSVAACERRRASRDGQDLPSRDNTISAVLDHGAISQGVVNVWRTGTRWPEERKRELATHLSREELARAERFHFKADFDRHVISRALTRRLVGSLVGLPPREVSLVSNRFGKPFISKDQNPLGLDAIDSAIEELHRIWS